MILCEKYRKKSRRQTMKTKEENEIELNGIKYIKKGTEPIKAKLKDGMEYCIVRTYSAGVFAGFFDRKTKGKEGTVYNARRLWYWDGAASLSQLAVDGTSKPETCKFPSEVTEIDLKEIVEVLPCTKKAQESIASVEIWQS
jgi:hypothetical protein